MNKIREWFENDAINSNEKYAVYEYNGLLEVKTNELIFLIVSLHEGNECKWLLRVSTIAVFDRWVNLIAVEEFFDTDIELCSYLSDHKLDIYKQVVKYLIDEYKELEDNYND